MAKTLLDGVNDVLKNNGLIAGEDGELSTLTDNPRQTEIDVAIQCWNSLIVEVFDFADEPVPMEVDSTTITLATDDVDYDLPSNLVQIRWPLKNETYGYYITQYEGGWDQMFRDQGIPGNYTGRPQAAAIRPTDGRLVMEYIPTSQENGLAYTLLYDKELIMSAQGDEFPFNDTVYTVLLDAAIEIWRYKQKGKAASGIYKRKVAQAARLLTKNQRRDRWAPKRCKTPRNITDPMNA